jgi:hypothetical protein
LFNEVMFTQQFELRFTTNLPYYPPSDNSHGCGPRRWSPHWKSSGAKEEREDGVSTEVQGREGEKIRGEERRAENQRKEQSERREEKRGRGEKPRVKKRKEDRKKRTGVDRRQEGRSREKKHKRL